MDYSTVSRKRSAKNDLKNKNKRKDWRLNKTLEQRVNLGRELKNKRTKKRNEIEFVQLSNQNILNFLMLLRDSECPNVAVNGPRNP